MKVSFIKQMNKDIVKFNKFLNRVIKLYTKNAPSKLKQSIFYSLFPGGKRIRPLILFATSKMIGLKKNEIMYAACGIETLHNYSLIHDDLPSMDNDDYRRGKLTVHKKYGQALAILCGDALLTLSFELLSKIRNKIEAIKVIDSVAKYSGCSGLIAGQVLDISDIGKKYIKEIKNNKITNSLNKIKNLLRSIHINKTAKLIELCVVIPAILCKLNKKKIRYLHTIGRNLGLIFQITDDILDCKEEKQKITYPFVFGIKKTKEIVDELYKNSVKLIEENFPGKRNSYLLNIFDIVRNREA